MIKRNKGLILLTSLVTLFPMAVGLVLWNHFPEQMPIHWNASGEIDSWGSKLFAVVLMPMLLLGIHWLCIVATASDPKSKDIDGKPLHLVLWICPFMSILVCALVYTTACGLSLSVETLMPLLMGLMFLVIGNYLPKCKRNYSIGIKVSWALEDEDNWNATHRFAGKLWAFGGTVIMITSFLSSFTLFLIITLAMVVVPVGYSYLYYRNHKKEDRNEN